MKKVLAILLTVVFAASLCFAGGKQDAKGGQVVLKIWESEGPEKDFMLWAASEFTKLHPNVTFEYEPVGNTDTRSKIELDGPAGAGADIFVSPHDHIGALVNGGHILVNEAAGFASNFVDAAITATTYNGKLYGYPIAIETYALFYNKNVFKKPPKTWEEVEAFAKKWTDKSKNKYAIAWEPANAYFDYIFMSGFGAPLFGPNGNDRKQHNINSAGAVEGLRYFQSLRKSLLDVPSADVSADFCNSSFIEGNIPLLITGPWKIADFLKAGVNFGIVELPVFPGQKKPPASFSGIRVAFVSAYSDHPAEAIQFAEFICSKAVLEKRYELTKQIPPRKDITIKDPLSNGILAQAKYATPMPSIPEMGTYWSAMGAAFASIWDGADVKAQLNNAAAAMESVK